MTAAVPNTAKSPSVRRPDVAAGPRLVVDNGPGRPDGQSRQPAAAHPLPWAACLLLWALFAAVGWGALALLLPLI